jgi:quercetin dioxygenase-like cupin family protein
MSVLFGYAGRNGRLHKPERHENDFETCIVYKGAIRVILSGNTHELKAGESIQFDALFDHEYEAVEDCEICIIHLRKPKRF